MLSCLIFNCRRISTYFSIQYDESVCRFGRILVTLHTNARAPLFLLYKEMASWRASLGTVHDDTPIKKPTRKESDRATRMCQELSHHKMPQPVFVSWAINLGETFRRNISSSMKSVARLWRYRRYIRPKRRMTFGGLNVVILQDTELFDSWFV